MRQVVSVETGGSPCGTGCPYYTESGIVRGVNGVPLQTHCRAIMETIFVDCDKYNPHTVEKMAVTEEEWKTMQSAVGKKARKERKAYPEDHEEIHPVGWNWKHDRWKAGKSSSVKQ